MNLFDFAVNSIRAHAEFLGGKDMLGSPISRFKTEDCAVCKLPHETVMPCDFCEAFACIEDFQNIWKKCADCGRIGCREHFLGMFCRKCTYEDEE